MEKTDPSDSPKETPPSRRAVWILLALVLLLAAVALIGITQRHARTEKLRATAAAVEQHVNVVRPTAAPASVNLVLPGQTQAFTEAPIFAQTNGYLKKWYFDIGAHVKKGDILAEIDTPTVDQQLAQAEGQLAESQAMLVLAQATYTRQQTLLKRDVISQQDFDDATSDLQSKKAAVVADTANVDNLKALQAFKILHAPFDGIVSARNTDIGDLVKTDSTIPLFVVSKISPLRVYIQVPQTLAALVKKGTQADLTFDTFPARTFPAEVTATSGAIDETSRTLLTELSVPNANGELFPGAYTRVHLHLDNSTPSLTVPANVLLFRSEGPAIGVVDANGKVEIRPVKIGRDLGNTLEILQGLTPDDQLIVNPPDSLATGDQVKINPPPKT